MVLWIIFSTFAPKFGHFFVVKGLRHILLLLIIGLYACGCSDLSIQENTSHSSEASGGVSSVINDISDDYAKRLQQHYDWTDAITSSYQLSSNNQENRLRTRRHERISTSWQLRTNEHQQYAALLRQASSISHIINRIVAISSIVPLSLPAEQISFPFHSFW